MVIHPNTPPPPGVFTFGHGVVLGDFAVNFPPLIIFSFLFRYLFNELTPPDPRLLVSPDHATPVSIKPTPPTTAPPQSVPNDPPSNSNPPPHPTPPQQNSENAKDPFPQTYPSAFTSISTPSTPPYDLSSPLLTSSCPFPHPLPNKEPATRNRRFFSALLSMTD